MALFVVVVVGLVLSYPDFDSTWAVLLAGVGTAVAVPLLFFGSARTLWMAVDLCMRPLAPGEASVEKR